MQELAVNAMVILMAECSITLFGTKTICHSRLHVLRLSAPLKTNIVLSTAC